MITVLEHCTNWVCSAWRRKDLGEIFQYLKWAREKLGRDFLQELAEIG